MCIEKTRVHATGVCWNASKISSNDTAIQISSIARLDLYNEDTLHVKQPASSQGGLQIDKIQTNTKIVGGYYTGQSIAFDSSTLVIPWRGGELKKKKNVALIGGTVNRTRAGADLDQSSTSSPATTRRHTKSMLMC